jgi:hypothetical protein
VPRFLLALAPLAAVGLLAASCTDQTAAIRFGDETVSEDDLLDELEALASTAGDAAGEPGQYPRGELEDSYDQGFAGQVVTQRLQFMIFDQIFEDEDLELTQADRDQVRGQLEGDPSFLALPSDYQESFVQDIAKRQAVQATLDPPALNDAIAEVVDTNDIEISSRFGTWDPLQGVVPPEGPLQPGGGETPDDTPLPEG